MKSGDRDLLDRRNGSMAATYRLFYEEPVHLVSGAGTWLFDEDGNRYLDAYNNVAVVGHSHPDVVAALCDQAGRLNTHTRYLSRPVVEYAEALLATFGADLDRIVFTCTGSEANDLACRVAREATGGDGFIVTENAYHGTTTAVAALSPSLGDRPDPAVWTVPAPDTGDDAPERFGAAVADCAERMRASGVRPAALFVDTIMSSDGIRADPAGLLGPAVDEIHAAGGLYVADEVQAGFGRLGAGMWGFDRHRIDPDLVSIGKPMGNGHPMAGLAGRREFFEDFGRRVRYFNTFAGNPVSASVGMAVLDVIDRENLLDHAATVGAGLRAALSALAGRHPVVCDVRGAGMFVGLHLAGPDAGRTAHELVNAMRRRRVLISSTGSEDDVLKIRPPLPFGRSEVDMLTTALDDSLTEVNSAGAGR